MKKILIVSAVVLSLFGTSIVAVKAAPKGPDEHNWHITSIAWIESIRNNMDEDDRWVVLCGKVTKKVKDETYSFNDGTGTIQLDTDGKDLPVGKAIVIRGKVDQEWIGIGKLEVDVHSFRLE